MEVLKVQPFTNFGSPMEIVSTFGSKKAYLQAVHELENELYKTA
jgi:type I restriction enzyme R subunit